MPVWRETIFFIILLLCTPHMHCTYHPSFFNEEELRHIRDLSDEHITVMPSCDEHQIMLFLADAQVINPESIIALGLDNSNLMCRLVTKSLETIKDYFKTCLHPNDTDLYMSLIRGMKTLYKKLCTESEFVRRFQTFFKCLHELSNDLESCDGPADWNESKDDEKVCKAYKEISDCYYVKTAEVCGKDAAAIVKELLTAIIDSILFVKCSYILYNPEVDDAMPETYVRKISDPDLSKGISQSDSVILMIIVYVTRLYF